MEPEFFFKDMRIHSEFRRVKGLYGGSGTTVTSS